MLRCVARLFVLFVILMISACGSGESDSTEGGEDVATQGEEGGINDTTGSEGTPPGEEGGGDADVSEGGGEDIASEGGDENGGGSEEGDESNGEDPGEGGGDPILGLLPEGEWLLRVDDVLCVDFSGLAAPLSMAGYAVLIVDGEGKAELSFFDASWEEFKGISFTEPDLSEAGVYRVSMPPTEVPEPGANCMQTLSFEMTLEESAGGMVGMMAFSEAKKGGGCSTDGCEGTMALKVSPLGQPVAPTSVAQPFPYVYVNAIEGVEEEGEIYLYTIQDQPYFFLFDIPSPNTNLDAIRGKRYIAGGNHLWGRAMQFFFDGGCTNIEQWDLSMSLVYGADFSASLEHKSVYHVDCEDMSEDLSIGEMSAPAP